MICVHNYKIFPGVISPYPQRGRGDSSMRLYLGQLAFFFWLYESARLNGQIRNCCRRRSVVRCPSRGHISKTKQDRPHHSYYGSLLGSRYRRVCCRTQIIPRTPHRYILVSNAKHVQILIGSPVRLWCQTVSAAVGNCC